MCGEAHLYFSGENPALARLTGHVVAIISAGHFTCMADKSISFSIMENITSMSIERISAAYKNETWVLPVLDKPLSTHGCQ